ncbi:uncharacterized protein PV09_09348 [Verruconis gallopava]|uniref:Histidine acid phosphatase n=1 Tax=Verruconis gallopava TaxID=253628 RepID=A0A0D1ZWN7_9PEZI|nr:uncharacterized protein PV09_09348 [Verruconis gallopava]KIV98902.1 hypothetical protein PV09_09348 [Verruconis gallopava]
MMALFVAVLLTIWVSFADAQNYTVHSAFIFANTGDRTPLLDVNNTPALTYLGAQQMANLGAYFRRRYIGAGDVNPLVGSTMLDGLSSWRVNNDAVFVQAVDSQYTVASATAFMQGLYPPYTLGAANQSSILDPSAITSNGTYIEAPLNGYQYAVVNTVGSTDPYVIYLTGTNNCQSFGDSAQAYYSSETFNNTEEAVQTLYQSLGHAVLNGVIPQDQWSFANAYLIYDYISYQYNHNSTAYDILSGPGYKDSYDQLYGLASEKQWEIYGDQSVSGLFAGDKIRTIGGQTLAARAAGLLLNNIDTGGSSTKISLAVGEYDVMMALFSLLSLQDIDTNFEYIPPFASAFAFELFSYENETSLGTYPDTDSLWVRFLYINGSLTNDNPNPSIQAYPIFSRGPSETDMKWNDFFNAMVSIGMENVGDWCVTCNANSVFCPAFTDSTGSSGSSSSSRGKSSVSPAVAGVIGAVVTLAVVGLLLGLAMLLGGVRFHRNPRSRKRDLGGFKGSAKLASDADLHLPKNAAPVGVVATEVANDQKRGHERVGSWEMDKKPGRDTFSSLGGATVKGDDYGAKSSLEEERDGISPFSAPVHPRESI